MSDGRDAHRAVNLARMAQGLAWCRSAPTATARYEGDVVEFVGAPGPPAPVYPLRVHPRVVWTPPGGGGGLDYVLLAWGLSVVSGQAGRVYTQGVRWLGSVAASPGVPVSLDEVVLSAGIAVPGASLALRVGICEVGLSAFVSAGGRVLNVGP
jgi:hypothetical protein